MTRHALADRRSEHAAARYDDPRITTIGLFTEAMGGLNARFAAQYAEHDLSPAEFEVLMRLARTPGHALRMSDLAAQTQLTDIGENAYQIDWLNSDQSIAVYLDNNYLKYTRPADVTDWDHFTTLDQLATVVTFEFQYASA